MTIFPEFQSLFFFFMNVLCFCLPNRFPGVWKIIVLAIEYVEPWYSEPQYSKVLSITNDFLYPSNSKMYGNEPQFNETLLVKKFCWLFVISRFNCSKNWKRKKDNYSLKPKTYRPVCGVLDLKRRIRLNLLIKSCNLSTDLIKEVLTLDEQIQALAQELYQQKSLLVMGRGFQFATCLEGALVIIINTTVQLFRVLNRIWSRPLWQRGRKLGKEKQ